MKIRLEKRRDALPWPRLLQSSHPTLPDTLLAEVGMFASRLLRALPPTLSQTLRSPPPPELEITIQGWVTQSQLRKHFSFLKITDGSSKDLQIFVQGAKGESELRRYVSLATSGGQP